MRLMIFFSLVFCGMIFITVPADAAKSNGFIRPYLIAADPEVTDATDPDTGVDDNPKPTPVPVVNTNSSASLNSSRNSPQATASQGPTASPGTVTGNTGSSSDPIHNRQQSAKKSTGFKIWLNQYTLRDFFALKDRFWDGVPFYAGFWALIFILAVVFYLFKWKHLRQPLLLLSAVFFGFFLGGVPNPINGIFEILANHQVLLNIILIGLPVGLSFLWGRFYCGWICPLGAIQEFLYPAPEGRSLPQPLDRVLKYLKYFTLIIIGYLSWHATVNLWQPLDPSRTLFTFGGTLTAIIIMAAIILFSILVPRPFCKYLCPLGAILALTSKLALFRMRADVKKCMVCGKCRVGECPMDAISAFNPEVDLPRIDNSECIKCSHCQKNCKRSALRVTGFKIDHVYIDTDQNIGNYD
jgi:ferredoxin